MVRALSGPPGRRHFKLHLLLSTAATLLATSLVTVSSASPAQDMNADDFRVRIGAAIVLGRTHPPEARAILEKALSDPHPAVRTAAAASLATLGDAAAIPALEKHLATEGSPGVKAQLEASLAQLRSGGAAQAPVTKYFVKLGAMKNLTNVRGEQLTRIMRQSAREKAQSIPGAVVTDAPSDNRAPVLILDGSLTKLAQQQKNDGSLAVSAEVEFSVRKSPEHALKASLSGAATSLGAARSVQTPGVVISLQDSAVDGAVGSAMKNAERGFSIAAQ